MLTCGCEVWVVEVRHETRYKGIYALFIFDSEEEAKDWCRHLPGHVRFKKWML